jgi:hydrogenase maturation protein HypF
MAGVSRREQRRVRSRILVEGAVQGVGFRPFVYRLASELGLAGVVGNDSNGVFVEVEGSRAKVARFTDALQRQAPPLAIVEEIVTQIIEPTGERAFAIADSAAGEERRALISPDVATCGACLAEVLDPRNRRYRYAFTNCTNCGPRFTIVDDVPYDRASTTMAGFAMCSECDREYHDPTDRRFHAQPLCCGACGPELRLVDADGVPVPGDPVVAASGLISDGSVVAIKGLGGYHLAVDAGSESAVHALRSRKYREDKPFALMAPDLEAVERFCLVDSAEEAVLTSPRRPIVLLRRRQPSVDIAPSVAPASRFLGVMLPYAPLHHLLARELRRPFVLTSANVADEPIAYSDDDAFERLKDIADHFLTHDRPIRIRTDDSVTRVVRGRELLLRRSRGHVPQPFTLPWAFRRPVLACGAELKNNICIGKERRAFLSHHIGDLENLEAFRSFTEAATHLRRLFDVRPELVVHDLHPEYLSTKYALDLDGVELEGVQHHHAHIASCLADNRESGPVIGVAFDGLGYGTDATMWGGEVLVADLVGFERAAHLDPVPMPGGSAAIREPWRMAASFVDLAFEGAPPDDLGVARRQGQLWNDVTRLARARVNSPMTSSAGRLFDALSAILGVRDSVAYEGQAAVELEQLADPNEHGAYPTEVGGEQPLRLVAAGLVRGVVNDVRAGVDRSVVAARFHNGLVDATVRACKLVGERAGIRTVALSGGVFQNLLLLTRTSDGLGEAGFRVLTHSRVPPNDGGISLGQAVVAGARDRLNRCGEEGHQPACRRSGSRRNSSSTAPGPVDRP